MLIQEVEVVIKSLEIRQQKWNTGVCGQRLLWDVMVHFHLCQKNGKQKVSLKTSENWLCSWQGVTLSLMSALCEEGKWAGKEKTEHEGVNVEGMQIDKNHRITEWWGSALLTPTSFFTSKNKVLKEWLCELGENLTEAENLFLRLNTEQRWRALLCRSCCNVQSGSGAASFCFSAFCCVLENSSDSYILKVLHCASLLSKFSVDFPRKEQISPLKDNSHQYLPNSMN